MIEFHCPLDGKKLDGDTCPECGYKVQDKDFYENLDTGLVRLSTSGERPPEAKK